MAGQFTIKGTFQLPIALSLAIMPSAFPAQTQLMPEQPARLAAVCGAEPYTMWELFRYMSASFNSTMPSEALAAMGKRVRPRAAAWAAMAVRVERAAWPTAAQFLVPTVFPCRTVVSLAMESKAAMVEPVAMQAT